MHDDLFQLIKSLSRSEKRHFSLHASIHRKDAQHMLLFKALEKQNTYNEEAIRRMFREKGFTEQISVAKNYLYRLIMKVLRSYHSEISMNARVKDMLRDAEILKLKGLHSQSGKMLGKAASIAESNNFHYHLMEINYWQRTLLHEKSRASGASKNLRHEYEAIHRDTQRLITNMDMVDKSSYVFDRLSERVHPHVPGVLEQLRQEMPEGVLSGEIPDDASYITRMHMMYARINYLWVACDFPEHYRCTREFIKLAEECTWRNARTTNHRIIALDMILKNLTTCGRYSEAMDFMDRFHEESRAGHLDADPVAKSQFLSRYFEYQLAIDAGTGEFTAAKEKIPGMLAELEEFGNYLTEEQHFALRYAIGVIYFGTRDFRSALRWMEPLINYGLRDHASDWMHLYSTVRMFQLLAHYELGNEEVLEYMLKSYYRFLARKKQPYRTEELLLRFLQRVLRLADRRDIPREFARLASELQQVYNNPFEYWIFSNFDILAWTESKVQGRPFSELMREHAEMRRE